MTREDAFRQYVFDEMSKFRNPSDLEAFLESLKRDEIGPLCGLLSRWRKNGIARFIASAGDRWAKTSASIHHIVVGQINPSVNPILERHGYRLAGIVNDPDARGHPEFKTQGAILSGILIARRHGDDFTLIDGNHRAIRMRMDGETEFTVLIPD